DEFFADFAAQAAAKAGTIPVAAPTIVPSPEATPVVAAAEASASAPAPEPEPSKGGLSPWVWIGGLTVVVGAILAVVAPTRYPGTAFPVFEAFSRNRARRSSTFVGVTRCRLTRLRARTLNYRRW